MILMKVRTVAMDQQENPVVLLVDETETRALPIWIGRPEAQSIALELQAVPMPRPMTHDLIREMFTQLKAQVTRIVIADIQNGTYFAEIHLQSNGTDIVLDSRPSDAIALALRTKAPIYVDEKIATGRSIPLDKERH